MSVVNLANLSAVEFAKIETDLANCRTLGQVLTWASTKPKGDFLPQIVAETIAQDEYTIDIIIPYKELFLVYDTT